MILRTLTCTILLSLSACFLIAQDFEQEYFKYEDFTYVDGMQHADFDGDGLQDFLLTASNFGLMKVGLNKGLEAPDFVEIPDVRSIQQAIVVDFDGDGDSDIVGRKQWSGVQLFLNDGEANFEHQQLDIEEYESIAFADLTGDGSLEMILGRSFELAIYQIDQSNLELTEIYTGDHGTSPNATAGAVTALDYDKDGDQDIIINYESAGVVLLESTSALVFDISTLYEQNYDAEILEAVNFNNDDILDFVLYSEDDNRARILVSDGNGSYTEEDVSADNINNSLTLAGDLNGDTTAELVAFESTSFDDPMMYIKQYDNGLTNILTVNDHYAVSAGGITDINNDGFMDFYFFQNDARKPGLIYYLSEGFLVDADGDGYDNEEDCDDENPDINPGQAEEPYNGIDDDCNTATLDDDLDQDGFLMVDDCDDTNAMINPDAFDEPGNGIDEDCDGVDPVSTYELSNAVVSIYPNPVVESLHIDIEGSLKYQIKVFDQDGKLLFKNNNTRLLPFHAFPDGIYLLEIGDLNSGQKVVERIIKGN